MVKKLYKSSTDKRIAGICGGIGVYFGIDPVLVRLLWCVLTLAGGSGIFFYLLAWLIIPTEPDYNHNTHHSPFCSRGRRPEKWKTGKETPPIQLKTF